MTSGGYLLSHFDHRLVETVCCIVNNILKMSVTKRFLIHQSL